MTEITHEDRDNKTGRFLPGNSGFGGRPRGARSKLGEAFLEDLRDAWNEHGKEALRRCATEDPSQFCRIISNLLPRDIDINLTGSIDVADFATRFRTAVELLGNEPPQPKMRTIEHKATSSARKPA
jgi:hypothetical protein